MKQHILSLTLLLSAPALTMEPKSLDLENAGRGGQLVPREEAETSEAFIGFHTIEEDKPLSIVKYALLQADDLAQKEVAGRAQAQAKDMEQRAARLTAEVEAGQLLQKIANERLSASPESDYESDSEKGLCKENIQIYRFNKLAVSIKQILINANYLLLAWNHDPINTQPSRELAQYSKNLDAQLNRLESWQKQIDSINYRKITGYSNLKLCFETMSKGINTLFDIEQLQEKTNNISNHAVQFLMTFERLESLLK